MYQKAREEFGKQCKFKDVPAQVLHHAAKRKKKESDEEEGVEENRVVSVGNSIFTWDSSETISRTKVSTHAIERADAGMFHEEGGWIADIHKDDESAVKRFRKRRERGLKVMGNETEPLGNAIKSLGPIVEVGVKQNNTVNIYEMYFDDALEDHSTVPPSARGMAVLKDPSDVVRTASSIDWYSEGASRVAVSYSISKFQDSRLMQKTLPVESYIWDVQKPNAPEMALKPNSPLLSLRFNPKNPDTLIGGSYNGVVSFFDRRKKQNTPWASSAIEKSHHDPVYDVRWSQSKTGTLCCSCSTDGQLLWWDTRRLSEPSDSIVIKNSKGIVYGASSMDWNPDAGMHKYLVGTEQGVVASVNLRNRKVQDGLTMTSETSERHHGPIYAIERNPFNPKYYMTIGDWTARMWTEELRSPIMTTKYMNSRVTSGSWSPTRPGVFVVTKADGTLDVWDYFSKQNEVVLSHKIGDAPLSSVSISQGGSMQMIGVGDESGTVSLLQLSESLTMRQNNEKQAMANMFQRETLRERNLMIIERENQRQWGKANDGGIRGVKSNVADTKETTTEEQELLLKIESDFLNLISDN